MRFRKYLFIPAAIATVAMVRGNLQGIFVALPQITLQFHLSPTTSHWVININQLATILFMLICGRLGDRFGHEKTYLTGAFLFLAGSVIAARAPSISYLLVAQFIIGLGTSFLLPSNIVLITRLFGLHERGKMLGMIIGFGAIYIGFSPLIAGSLTSYLSWRYVYWIKIPFALVVVTFTLLSLKQFAKSKKQVFNFDYSGALVYMLAISSLIVSLMQEAVWGWLDPKTIILFAVAILSFIGLIIIEQRKSQPLVSIQLLKNKLFLRSNIIIMLVQFSTMFVMFWAIWLQAIKGYSAVVASLVLLVNTLPIMIVSPLGGQMLDKYGPRLPVILGISLLTLGLAWLDISMSLSHVIGWLLVGTFLFGVGNALIYPVMVTLIASSVPDKERGVASGILNTIRQFSSALSIAILGTVLIYVTEMKLTTLINSSAAFKKLTLAQLNSIIHHFTTTLPGFSVSQMNVLVQQANYGYSKGFQAAILVAAVMVFIALLLAIKYIPKQRIYKELRD